MVASRDLKTVDSMDGPALYRRARQLIPGGTQLLSKRPEMFLPERWPAYYRSARGYTVEGLDGARFLDFSIMGVGACILGYADPDVDAAVHAAIDQGVNCTLNAPEEVELAERLCDLHSWAERVRYARSGGEAMSMAVRIARAATGRELVAFSGYHGWTDWYLAANLADDDALDGHLMPGLAPAGVPRGLAGTARPFHYNRLEELEAIVDEAGNRLAAIVMEPQRGAQPLPGFLEGVRSLADRTGAVLIYDEITTGFRACPGGIHLLHGIDPDMAVFAKAMANGYAMSAVIGRAGVMEAAQDSFISSTNWTERLGPVAALATLRKLVETDAHEHLRAVGERVQSGWAAAARRAGLDIGIDGLPSLSHFRVKDDPELLLTSLFVLRMLERGYLAFDQFKPSLAHDLDAVETYLADCEMVFQELAEARDQGDAAERLGGEPARRGFYRLTD